MKFRTKNYLGTTKQSTTQKDNEEKSQKLLHHGPINHMGSLTQYI